MLIHTLLVVILIVLMIRISLKAYDYVPLSRFHHFIIPVYSVIMFLITFRPGPEDFRMLGILLIVALVAGWYEASGIQVRRQLSRRGKKLVWHVKRNTPYIIGSVLTTFLGIGLNIWQNHEQFLHLFEDKVFEEILEELDPLAVFTQQHAWYIWLLTGVAALMFAWRSAVRIRQEIALESGTGAETGPDTGASQKQETGDATNTEIKPKPEH